MSIHHHPTGYWGMERSQKGLAPGYLALLWTSSSPTPFNSTVLWPPAFTRSARKPVHGACTSTMRRTHKASNSSSWISSYSKSIAADIDCHKHCRGCGETVACGCAVRKVCITAQCGTNLGQHPDPESRPPPLPRSFSSFWIQHSCNLKLCI